MILPRRSWKLEHHRPRVKKGAVDAAPSVDAVEGAASGLLRFSGGASERGNAGRGGRTL